MEENEKYIEEEEMTIDWMEIIRKLFRGWKFIILVTFLFSVLGVAAALMAHRKYQVKVTLAPEMQNRTNGTLSAITSMLGGGATLNSSPDALNITLFPEISASTPFLCSLLEVPVTPYISRKSEVAGARPDTTTVFLHMLGRDKKLSEKKARKMAEADAEYLYDDNIINPDQLTPRQYTAVKGLREAVSTNVDNKTGVTTITVTLDDPMIAKQLADTVTQRLQDFVIDYRTKKATADYEYYVQLADEAKAKLVKAQAAYAARVDYDRSVILQSVNSERQRLQDEATLANQIYSQMAQQRELAKAKIQEMKPVYAVVQPATVPLKSITSRAKICVIWFFVGFLLSCFWVAFGKDLWKKGRTMLKESKEPTAPEQKPAEE